MKSFRILFWISLFTFITALVLLVSGSPILMMELIDKSAIPLGTPITWAGMIAFPFAVFFGIRRIRIPSERFCRLLQMLLFVSIGLAFIWVPVSYLISGNLSFSFSEKQAFRGGQTAMKLFWIYSFVTGLLPLLVLFLFWISILVSWLKGKLQG